MPSIEYAKRLFRASLPAFGTLLFWVVLSWFAVQRLLVPGIRRAGLVMAALYVLVAGRELAPATTTPRLGDLEAVLYQNAQVGVAAAGWLLAGILVGVVDSAWAGLGLPGAFTSPLGDLLWVFSWSVVATVGIYVVAATQAVVTRADHGRAGDAATPLD